MSTGVAVSPIERVGKWAGQRYNIYYSANPAKQLLYLHIRDYMRGSKGSDVGLDLGCGSMKLRPLFQTREYIGVDINPDSIGRGLKQHPGATGVVEDIRELDPTIRGDFVTCFQMIGVNQFYYKTYSDGVTAADDLLAHVAEGGTLLFNIGMHALQEHAEIESHVDEHFESVSSRTISYWNPLIGPYASFPLALIPKAIPPVERFFKTKYILYVCQGRR